MFGGDPERIALLPPIEFNLEEDIFSNEPLSDIDPSATDRKKRRGGPYGASAPVSLGSFWAPAVSVAGQPDTLALNAESARIAVPLSKPAEGHPLWLGIGRFGRLEIASDAFPLLIFFTLNRRLFFLSASSIDVVGFNSL